jgi:hypothetical protein
VVAVGGSDVSVAVPAQPFFVTVRHTCATWAAPSNSIQAGTSKALIVWQARRPWPVLTQQPPRLD